MATKKTRKLKPKDENITIKLAWGNPADVLTVYANNLYITHAGNEFYLVFGETPPIAELDASRLPEHLEIKPVAKIAVTQENMVKFADAIAENTAKFKERVRNTKGTRK